MLIRALLVFSLALTSFQLLAKEPSMGPIISDYGPTYPVNDRDIPLQEDFVYRTVFDVATYSGITTSLNRKLTSIARFMNMHARNGVPVENMDIAVVIHGKALTSVLSNDAYKIRYDGENPNHDLLISLHEAGVKFYACGQSMAFGRIDKNELASPIKVALSAMTMLTVLQSEGYALLP